jgi:peptidoglycan/LPS O-acetylase OafA/YrhL
VKLRILHPVAALLIGASAFIFVPLFNEETSTSFSLWRKRALYALALALCIGVATIVLLSPLWLKTLHLLMTNVLVIMFSLCVFHAMHPQALPPNEPSRK